MRFRLRYWLLGTFIVAIVLSKMIGIWFHDPTQMIREPIWVLPDVDEKTLQTTLAALQGPAPEVVSETSIRQLVRILEDYGQVTISEFDLSDVGLQLDDHLCNPNGSHRYTLGGWLEASLKRNDLTFTIERGFIQIVPLRFDPNLTRIYPHPIVASLELKENLQEHVNPHEWQFAGGDSVVIYLDTKVSHCSS